MSVFQPKLFTTLRTYDGRQFSRDLVAGLIVGIIALPLAIAFAIASGVSPDRGLWTAIVAGFLISALGGSRVQIGGPTGAFVVIVYGIVQRYGVDGLTIATLMAGVILVIMGVAGLGSVIEFIPRPLITGFTSGIAVIILSGEVRDFFGLRMDAVPAAFAEKWAAYAHSASSFSPQALLVAGSALAIILLWPRLNARIPGPFIALVVTTVGTALLHLEVETVGSRFGSIATSIPHPVIPHLTLGQVRELVGPAFSIALLGAVESLLSAVVADGMIGSSHRSNTELIAQGIANLAAPLVGGIPATGAIARTATNVKNGGRTPIAGMIHAVTLLAITLFAGRWAVHIPMATLAAILVVVAYHMSEWREFLLELRSPKSDVAVLLTTFLLTIFVDLTVAIGVGIVLAAMLFMRRMAAETRIARMGDDQMEEDVLLVGLPKGVVVYEVRGAFFFGAAAQFKSTLASIDERPRVLIIRMRHVTALDSTGLHALRDVVSRFRDDGTRVILAELSAQPLAALRASAVFAEIGSSNVIPTFQEALSELAA
jgi:SulP family sulfate permease